MDNKGKKFKNFSEFYTFYLSEHSDRVNRRLHFSGCILIIVIVLFVIVTHIWIAFILVPLVGYGFAWVGHYFVEKNKPATFTYPVYSLIGDWVMFKDMVIRKIKL